MSNPASFSYQAGFGSHLASEARAGALPVGRNNPQLPPYGLYPEAFSGTAFTAPRSENRRSWLYRIRPSVVQGRYERMERKRLRSGPFTEAEASPAQLRWSPIGLPTEPTDFIDGLVTMGGNGSPAEQAGAGMHLYAANQSMRDRVFCNADGEMLIVPQQARLSIMTEMGLLEVGPGEIALLPRGMRFRVALPEGPARGYICENYGAMFRLPELGPIGSNGLANPRDFLAPVAHYEDIAGPHQIVTKFMGGLWRCDMDHSPFDVVAWHGNLAPFKYSLDRFNAMGSISFDHPDPSIFTVLTSPSETPGTANCDFVVFPPRWMVAEDTFRPPWFHRNVMSEFMGLISGRHDAKADHFVPGGASLHNCMSPHGPDAATVEKASSAELKPVKMTGSLAFMFETRYVIRPTSFALESPLLQPDYEACWQGIAKRFEGAAP